MIKSKGANGTTGFLVICQVLQGLGGGIAACSAQLLAQGSVRHQDLGTATAFVLLWAAIGVNNKRPWICLWSLANSLFLFFFYRMPSAPHLQLPSGEITCQSSWQWTSMVSSTRRRSIVSTLVSPLRSRIALIQRRMAPSWVTFIHILLFAVCWHRSS